MSTHKAKIRRPIVGSYEVGYGKPPQASQFQPGKSGNPRGRPKGARNKSGDKFGKKIMEMVLEEAQRTIRVQDGGRVRTLPVAQAIVRSVSVTAMKGQPRAQRLFIDLFSRAQADQENCRFEHFKALLEYKDFWEQELDRRRRESIVAPDPIPHPDQIVIDVRAGTARIKGPLTKEEKTRLDKYRNAHEAFTKIRPELEAELSIEQDPFTRECIEHDLAQGDRLERIAMALQGLTLASD